MYFFLRFVMRHAAWTRATITALDTFKGIFFSALFALLFRSPSTIITGVVEWIFNCWSAKVLYWFSLVGSFNFATSRVVIEHHENHVSTTHPPPDCHKIKTISPNSSKNVDWIINWKIGSGITGTFWGYTADFLTLLCCVSQLTRRNKQNQSVREKKTI